jgi:hypothetical protein
VELAQRIVTDRDFLLGSVWEGSGEELHTNRHAARSSMYGQRILSGISGMLISLHAWSPDAIWTPQHCLEWSFDGPMFEGARVDAQTATDETGDRQFTVTSDGTRQGRGTLRARPWEVGPPVTGRHTRGRTMTGADVELMRHWLPPATPADEDLVPWPLLVLTMSGLVVRDKAAGDFELSLNRWLRWVSLSPAHIDDTVHCIVGAPERRASRSRSGLDVVSFDVDVVNSVSGDRIGHVDWVMMCR